MSRGEGALRVGLIGAGMIGELRARALARAGGGRLVAVADPRPEAARAAARHGRGVRTYAEGRELAADAGIDAVVLSTPPASHEPLGLACLEAGKHLLCEKPLAASVEACERLVAAAEARGLCLATGFTLRQTPAARLARRLVDAGEIGRVDHVRARHGHPGGADFGPAWIVDREASGGGTLMDNGIHVIDLARFFLGGGEASVGYASGRVWAKPGCEDHGCLVLRGPGGGIAAVESSWTEWRGYGYRVEVYGDRGYVRFGYPPLWLVHGRGEPGRRMRGRWHLFPVYQVVERLRGWRWSLVETLRLDLEGWLRAIGIGGAAPASGRDGLEAVRAALSAERLGC